MKSVFWLVIAFSKCRVQFLAKKLRFKANSRLVCRIYLRYVGVRVLKFGNAICFIALAF